MQATVIYYVLLFLSTVLVSAFFTAATRKFAIKMDITDKPSSERKIHKENIPLLGGIAIFLSYFLALFFISDKLMSGNLEPHHWVGVFSGALFLIAGGLLDDKYNLKPGQQLIFPIAAVLAVVAGGVGIEKVTNPFGGLLFLDQLRFPVLFYGGGWHYFVLIADGFTIIWLLGMMYTTKLLDAIDGLVSGVTVIGAFIIFLFTMTTRYYQPDIGIAALVFSAACLGFLIFNWHPAKIFLGEGGSLLAGFILGVLAIISGGKIAIALLIMGIPIMDVVWTIFRRLKQGRNPFRFADRLHLHHRLLDTGIGQRKTVLIYYSFSAIFGLCGLFLQSRGKLFALGILAAIMLIFIASFSLISIKNNK